MSAAKGSSPSQIKPNTMTLVINRALTIVWADKAALGYFGTDILNQPCHMALCASPEPCSRCAACGCFQDRHSHTDEYQTSVRGHGRRILLRHVHPAEFRPDGTLQYVKLIIEDITTDRIFEETMGAVESQMISSNGQLFFNALVQELCKILEAQMVYIGTFDPDHTQVETVAVAVQGGLAANFAYPLLSAPCRGLLDTPLVSCAAEVDRRYPQCTWLMEKKISGYIGVQLNNSHDRPLGVMAALYQEKIKDLELAETLMTQFARPVAVTLGKLVNQRMLEKYRHMAATSNDQLALLDSNYIYQTVNRAYAEYRSLSVEQIVGQSMAAIVGPEMFNTTIRPVAEECFQGRQSRLQLWDPPKGAPRNCLDMAFYPHYEKGTNRIKGFVLCAKDITRSKNLEANLRQAAKMEAIGRLAGGIVHDFNNILGAVVGYTDLALGIVEGQPEVAKYLKEIRQAGLRATELVKQILAFSRQDHEIREPIQPKTILKEALSLLRATIPANITIRKTLASEAYILADPIHLHQIVINLCTNAQHAMRDHGGTLSVRLKDVVLNPDDVEGHPDMRPGSHVRISFEDTGHGIPDDIRAKMFDPFFTTKGKGEGTGMGLTMVESIVKGYQGRIDLRSQVGCGTVIDIFLPAIQAEEEQESMDQAHLPSGEGQRILVVDDERHMVQVAGMMLKSLGYQVQTETDSRRALNLFRSDPRAFDLVLSDVSMPGISGDALAQQILELRSDIPVILMTGHSERVNQELIGKFGVKKLLAKPLPINKLAAAVAEVLDNFVH